MTLRPEDDDAARVWDIVRWGGDLADVVRNLTREQYQQQREKQLAVERCIEVIGEAAGQLSETFKAQHPEIPWRDIVGQRNIIAHGYFFLEQDRLWEVATEHAPRLIEAIKPLTANPPPDPEPES